MENKKEITIDLANKNASKKEANIFIGVPFHSRVEPDCLRCISLLGGMPGFNFYVSQTKGASIHALRNKMYKEFLETECDFFLGVDADTAFTPENFLQLYRQELPIVFGVYNLKGTKFLDAGNFKKGFIGDIGERFLQESLNLNEADWSGLGFYLAKRNFIKKINRPWFLCPTYERSNGEIDSLQEDIAFCIKIKEHGEKVMVDCNCKVEHVFRPDEIPGVASIALTENLWTEIIGAVETLPYKTAKIILKEMSLQLKPQVKKQTIKS